MTDHLSPDHLNALVDGELTADQLAAQMSILLDALLYLGCSASKPAQVGHGKGRTAIHATAAIAGAAGAAGIPRGFPSRRGGSVPRLPLHRGLWVGVDRWAGLPRQCSF
jgi:hypothetical protein